MTPQRSSIGGGLSPLCALSAAALVALGVVLAATLALPDLPTWILGVRYFLALPAFFLAYLLEATVVGPMPTWVYGCAVIMQYILVAALIMRSCTRQTRHRS